VVRLGIAWLADFRKAVLDSRINSFARIHYLAHIKW